jgi:NAD(P)-dependent dehydrogenase (short-subunit alcohol dehydrogenase family)
VIAGKEKKEDWDKSFKENFFSSVNLIKILEKKLMKTKGMIICISSICGVEYIKGAPITYSVSKSALNTFVKIYSKILGPKGVKINAIAPGNILFAGSVWEKKLKKNKRYVKKIINDEVSLKKLGSADDISNMVNYFINNNSEFINGSIFVIDGGQLKSF